MWLLRRTCICQASCPYVCACVFVQLRDALIDGSQDALLDEYLEPQVHFPPEPIVAEHVVQC